MTHLDESSQRQISQERAENYVESIFMHTGEAVETFENYFQMEVKSGIISPDLTSPLGLEARLEQISNGELISLLLSEFRYRKEIVSELQRRVYQLAQQHGVIDEMVEKTANDIYNSDDLGE